MTRILHEPLLGPSARPMATIQPALDPALHSVVERAAQDAYQRGVADGRAAGRRETRDEAERLATSVQQSLAELTRAVRSMRIEHATGTVDLAMAIAAHVLDREPGDGGQALLQRVREWLSAIDDGPVQLTVSESDADVVTAMLTGRSDVDVVADRSLQQGEARLTGAWAHAELTRAARWLEVEEAIDGS